MVLFRRMNWLSLLLRAKANDERVIMTNGCFDLLHAGHVTYLEQAKALGDRLIVAVNSDASVSSSKANHGLLMVCKSV